MKSSHSSNVLSIDSAAPSRYVPVDGGPQHGSTRSSLTPSGMYRSESA